MKDFVVRTARMLDTKKNTNVSYREKKHKSPETDHPAQAKEVFVRGNSLPLRAFSRNIHPCAHPIIPQAFGWIEEVKKTDIGTKVRV
jgi:hypothetical protein